MITFLKYVPLLAAIAAPAPAAEGLNSVGPVYSPQTGKRVAAVNKSVEILRDPTRLNESFRQALKEISPRSGGAPSTRSTPLALPEIGLAAMVRRDGSEPSVMLRIEGRVQMVRQGDTVLLDKNKELIQVLVEEINPEDVRVLVLPQRETLILR